VTVLDLVNKKREMNVKTLNFKLWLAQKASVEYYTYLQNGGNARTAKDKVIDELKMKDDEWLQKEVDYTMFKASLSYLTDCLNIVSAFIQNDRLDEANTFLSKILV